MSTRLFPMVWAAGLILPAFAAVEAPEAAPVPARTEVEAIARELVAGIAAGDWAPWERHAADDLLYTNEFGRTMTKAEIRALFRPVPPAERGIFEMRILGLRHRGEAAVLVYDLHARHDEDVERFRVTASYWRVGEAWRLVAAQVGLLEDLAPETEPVGGSH
jgi:hypothetical protein